MTPCEIDSAQKAKPLGCEDLPGRDGLFRKIDSQGPGAEVSEGDGKLEVVSTRASSSRELLAPDLAGRGPGAKDEVLLAEPAVHDVLDPEMPVRQSGDFIQEDIPRSLGIRMELPRPLHHLRDVNAASREVEREVQDTAFSPPKEPLDDALRGR